MNKKDHKIRLKTICTWFLYSLEIKETRSPANAKYPSIVYKYIFDVRVIPALLVFIISIPFIVVLNGIKVIPTAWTELFNRHTHGDQTSDLNFKMTRIFAYNRF